MVTITPSRWAQPMHSTDEGYSRLDFDTFEDLMAYFHHFCEDPDTGFMNVPVWIDYEENEFVFGDEVILGLMQPRHGELCMWAAPWPEKGPEEALKELGAAVLRIWAGRADTGFSRHRRAWAFDPEVGFDVKEIVN